MADIDIRDDIIIIKIPTTKTKLSRKFVIIEPLWITIVKSYLGNRPTPDVSRAFIGFRGGKATKQNIGHNTISKMPKAIATFLNLRNAESYTGHTFRRTSATMLAEGGCDILSLKRLGAWKSSTVAEGYIEESLADKIRIARMVQETSTQVSHLLPVSTVPLIPTDNNQFNAAIPSTSFCQSSLPTTTQFDVAVPSTSFCPSPITPPMPESTVQNTVINIPVRNFAGPSSTGTGINMTCHNCTINYY